MPSGSPLVAFSDLRAAAYCPRQCYYRLRDGERERGPPASVSSARSLAHRYRSLLAADDATLRGEPVAREPAAYRRALEATRSRLERAGRWKNICAPEARDALVTGRECRGVIGKVLTDPLAPSLVSAGRPPERGVWERQSVHAVAAAKALAWERHERIEEAYLEYPRYGVIRRISLSTRRKAAYRRALRTVRRLDGPPPRVSNRSKCAACEYAAECGVRTRSLRSLLGRR